MLAAPYTAIPHGRSIICMAASVESPPAIDHRHNLPGCGIAEAGHRGCVPRRFHAVEKEHAVQRVRESGHSAKDVATELGINPRTLASWVRADAIDRRGRAWVSRIRPHFDFLTGYGFHLADVDAGHWWKVAATYRSAVSAVEVACSNEYQRVDLTLHRLVDGEVPLYPIFIVDTVPVDTMHADWLLELRAEPTRRPGHGLGDTEIEGQLAFWAAALRDHGSDFLAGDLAVLDQLERLIRDSARRVGPPQVTMWAPADSSPAQVADGTDRARAALPDGVAVEVRRYRW
jgi:hypothetical protein